MKKLFILTSLILLATLLSGCIKSKNNLRESNLNGQANLNNANRPREVNINQPRNINAPDNEVHLASFDSFWQVLLTEGAKKYGADFYINNVRSGGSNYPGPNLEETRNGMASTWSAQIIRCDEMIKIPDPYYGIPETVCKGKYSNLTYFWKNGRFTFGIQITNHQEEDTYSGPAVQPRLITTTLNQAEKTANQYKNFQAKGDNDEYYEYKLIVDRFNQPNWYIHKNLESCLWRQPIIPLSNGDSTEDSQQPDYCQGGIDYWKVKVDATNNQVKMDISSDFNNNSPIHVSHKCKDESYPTYGTNPPIYIANIPQGAQSLVVLINSTSDTKNMIHWLAWNIDPKTSGIFSNELPDKAISGTTSFNNNTYNPPCATDGSDRYIIRIYAIDTTLNLDSSKKADALYEQIKNHILDYSELIGT